MCVGSIQRRGFKNKTSLICPALSGGRNVWLLMHLQLYQTLTSPHFPCWKEPAELVSFLHVSAPGSPGCAAKCSRCVSVTLSHAVGHGHGPAVSVINKRATGDDS